MKHLYGLLQREFRDELMSTLDISERTSRDSVL